ncbi:MAG: type II toxin-antitoxin system VapB family antitoxin [Candidatus Solibacter sp.]
MRLNLEIDENLMREAMQATGLQTEQAVMELGLKTLVQRHRRANSARGSVGWQSGLDRTET